MPKNPYILHGLKYATLTLAAAVLLIAVAALMKGQKTSSLSGRLVAPQQNGTTRTLHIDEEQVRNGFTLEADANVIFTVPPDIERIPRITVLGGTDYDQKVRYWGYEMTGNEGANKAAGKTGNALYDGHFFYSLAERKAQTEQSTPADNDLVGILQSKNKKVPEAPASIAEIFYGGRTYFVMSSEALPASVLDVDNDNLNTKREEILGTDPNNPDTDGDGIPDDVEVFVTKTNPTDADTDHDGLTDACEDKNRDGRVDRDETSALNADTDRDGLCDGDGFATGCPEKKQTLCSMTDGNRVCEIRPSLPFSGEDSNQDCLFQAGVETDPRNPQTYGINDWTYKWNLFGGEPTVGKVAPDFPIPEMPAR